MAVIEKIELEKVEELFELFLPWEKESKKFKHHVFRGHSKEEYQLIPNALRIESKEWFWSVSPLSKPINEQTNCLTWQAKAENEILREFYKRADKEGLKVPLSKTLRTNITKLFGDLKTSGHGYTWPQEDVIEALGLAQHYGMPTRLLDWTYNPYVAFYFAFSGVIKNDIEGKLSIWTLNKLHIDFLEATINRTFIKFTHPHYSDNPNLRAQEGLFTYVPVKVKPSTEAFISGGQIIDRRPLNELIINQDDLGETNILTEIVLPCSEAKKGMQILSEMEYDERRIFPGYQGIADSILNAKAYI